MAPAEEAPHPAEHRVIELNSLVSEEEYVKNNTFDIRIFTDGSKIEGSVGAAISVWDRETEIGSLKLALPSYCTVYQAELLALCKAVEEARGRSTTKIGILSDSRSALETVSNSSTTHPLAVQTRMHLRECTRQNKEVSLFWIKAHVGLEGNERADQLAKEAALRSKRRHEYDVCPVSYIKRCIRQGTIDEWDRRYRTEAAASGTKLFFPDARAAYNVIRKMDVDPATTQLLTGHGGFSSYLNRFKCKESPSCECEPSAEETVEHLLLSCPIYAKRRFALEQRIDMVLTKDAIPMIMMNGKLRSTFLKYCKEIVEKVRERNK